MRKRDAEEGGNEKSAYRHNLALQPREPLWSIILISLIVSYVHIECTFTLYYGRDVEIWIYNSHSDVLENGMSYAEEAINKRPTNRDPTNPTEIRYHAYVISGNSLILCEDKIEDCIELLSKIN